MRVKLSVLAVFVCIQVGTAQLTCVKGDCVNGYGEAVFSSGSRYIGTFVNRKPHGYGTMIFPEGHHYTGSWKNQYREGKGTFTFADGDVYEGDFVQNTFEGLGVMTFKSGGIYDGNWFANAPNGYGYCSLKAVIGMPVTLLRANLMERVSCGMQMDLAMMEHGRRDFGMA